MPIKLIHVVLVCVLVPLFETLWGEKKSEAAPKSWMAILVYAGLVIGILAFVIPESQSLLSAIGFGAVLGFSIYGVHDFTIKAIKRNWDLTCGLDDVVWGAFLCSSVSAIVFVAGSS